MIKNAKHPVIEVLEGKIVTPVPVTPLHPGVPWFGPGYYIRSQFFELMYQHAKDTGSIEKTVSSDEILQFVLKAHDTIFREIMPLPACISPLCIGETMIPDDLSNNSKIVLNDNGFTWFDANGKELLTAQKNPNGDSWLPDPEQEADIIASFEDVDRQVQFLKDTVTAMKSGKTKRPLADAAGKYESGIKVPDWKAKYESGALNPLQKLKEVYANDLAIIEWQNPPFPAAYFWFGEEYYTALLMATAQQPQLIKDLLEFFLPRPEENWQYLRKAGVEVIFFQECLTGTEMINPDVYAEIIAPHTRRAVQFFKDLDFKVVIYYSGSVVPVLEVLKDQIPFDGFIAEESRKGYNNDISEIRSILGPNTPLLGNVDISLVEKGPRECIFNEVNKQIKAAGRNAPFIVCTGSPLTYQTPVENIRTFCETTGLLMKNNL